MVNTAKRVMAVFIRRFYDVCKYKASLGTAERSGRINGTEALLCPSLTALVAAWIASSRSSEVLRLTFFLPHGIVLQLAFQNSRWELPWAITYAFFIRHPRKYAM